MGRIAEAIAAGRRAVAQADVRLSSGSAGMVRALLAPGLSEAALTRALAAFGQLVGPGAGAVLICDRMPGTGLRSWGFEHLVPVADLLSAAPQASVMEHQVRRLRFILARRGVAECHWTGDEAADLVRLLLRRRVERGPTPVLIAPEAGGSGGDAGPGDATILRPLQLPD